MDENFCVSLNSCTLIFLCLWRNRSYKSAFQQQLVWLHVISLPQRARQKQSPRKTQERCETSGSDTTSFGSHNTVYFNPNIWCTFTSWCCFVPKIRHALRNLFRRCPHSKNGQSDRASLGIACTKSSCSLEYLFFPHNPRSCPIIISSYQHTKGAKHTVWGLGVYSPGENIINLISAISDMLIKISLNYWEAPEGNQIHDLKSCRKAGQDQSTDTCSSI